MDSVFTMFNCVYYLLVWVLFSCRIYKYKCDTIYGEDDTMHPVFIFGPMKRGEPMHHWLENPENGFAFFIQNAVTVQKFPMVIATKYNIPLVLYRPDIGHNIHGELYDISLRMIKKLDKYEFIPNEVIPRIEMIRYNDRQKNLTVIRPAMMYIKYYLYCNTWLELPFISDYHSKGGHGLEFRERPMSGKRKRVKKKKRLKYEPKKVHRRNITYVSDQGNYTYEVEDLSGDIARMKRRSERSKLKTEREKSIASSTDRSLSILKSVKLN